MSDNTAENHYRNLLGTNWEPLLKCQSDNHTIVSFEKDSGTFGYYCVIIYRHLSHVFVSGSYNKDDAIQEYIKTCKLSPQEINTLFKEKGT